MDANTTVPTPFSGCISACVRLSTTITFAGTEDQMYYIGPLLFWAWAEMTCGFFILSVPCLPRLLSESRLSCKVKNMLGLTPGRKSDDRYKYDNRSASGHTPRRKSQSVDLITSNAYYKMDGLTVKSSESQEQLRVDDEGQRLFKVTDGVKQARVKRNVRDDTA